MEEGKTRKTGKVRKGRFLYTIHLQNPEHPEHRSKTQKRMDFYSALKSQPSWLLLFSTIGLIALLKLTLSLLQWLYISFLRPAKPLKSYGSWALITGATDGIGKSFAFQFARQNLNLILVGRNPEKLHQVSTSIQSKYGSIRIETVVLDLAGDLVEGVERLKERIKGLDVGVLVNNAGVSYPYARYFHEVDEGLMRDLVKVNVEGVTRVTRAVVEGMVERRKGAIVNIGSGAAIVIPSDPLYSVYAASKA